MSSSVAVITSVLAATVFSAHTGYAQTSAAAQTDIAAYNCAKPASPLKANVAWKSNDDAMRWGEWRIRVGSNRVPVVVVVAVLSPARTQLTLGIERDGDRLGAWSIDRAPAHARIALNAGQFTDAGPWGWVVHNGREQQMPGTGSLAGALVVDTTGAWSLIDANEIQIARGSSRVREAVQSYPTLIAAGGRIPAALCAGSKDVDLTHRDTRLVVGTMPSGELLVAMTRFDGLGETAERLPIGPTTPEMIEIMRALGATRALMLDGGLSAQMLLNGQGALGTKQWNGLRKVPLALIGLPITR